MEFKLVRASGSKGLGDLLKAQKATFHKRSDTRKIIETAKHTLVLLPAYSPDLNDIKHVWAKTKAERRRTGASTEVVFRIRLENQN